MISHLIFHRRRKVFRHSAFIFGYWYAGLERIRHLYYCTNTVRTPYLCLRVCVFVSSGLACSLWCRNNCQTRQNKPSPGTRDMTGRFCALTCKESDVMAQSYTHTYRPTNTPQAHTNTHPMYTHSHTHTQQSTHTHTHIYIYIYNIHIVYFSIHINTLTHTDTHPHKQSSCVTTDAACFVMRKSI